MTPHEPGDGNSFKAGGMCQKQEGALACLSGFPFSRHPGLSLSINYPPQSLVSIVVFASCVIICPDKDEKLKKLNFLSSNVAL